MHTIRLCKYISLVPLTLWILEFINRKDIKNLYKKTHMLGKH